MKNSLFNASVLLAAAVPAVLVMPVHAEFSGNINVVSKYIFRGITNVPENNSPSLQGGFDYAHDSGFALGWWASNLGYGDNSGGNGFENDFYLKYSGSVDKFSYGATLTQYYYVDVKDADLTEAKVSLGFDAGEAGSFGLDTNVLLNEGSWGNTGDTYLALSYTKALPKEFTLGATLGYYFYDSSDNKYGLTTSEDSNFRNLDLKLSHPIGKTGADMGVTYIVAGKDRMGVEQDDTLLFSIGYAFDI